MERFSFKPSLLVTLLMLMTLSILVALGVWQLDRATQKSEIKSKLVMRANLPELSIGSQTLSSQSHDFRLARVTGYYDPDWMFFLDNQILDSRPGYHVIVPLRISGSERLVLVNRGWIAWGVSRDRLPVIVIPKDQVGVGGRLRMPAKDFFTLEDSSSRTKFERLWQNLDIERFEDITGLSVQPLILELDPSDLSDPAPDLIQRWREYDDSWIERHRAYAFQWFGLALVLIILYFILNLKRKLY